jgi:hypothetical protein
MMSNDSLAEAKRKFVRSAIQVSFVAQEGLDCRHSYRLDDVTEPLEQDLMNYGSMIGGSQLPFESMVVEPVRRVQGELKVQSQNSELCGWCFRPPTLPRKCRTH